MPPRMRTLSAAFAWVKENDPETSLTKTALRNMVITGAVPSVRIGEGSKPKYLINLDALSEYLYGSIPQQQSEAHGIREVRL